MRVSTSSIKTFKACRRKYQLKYIEGLEPIQKSNALESGSNYHSKLEELYTTGSIDTSQGTKEDAMALAYQKYIYPKFKCKSVEDWHEYEWVSNDTPNKLVGRFDGIAEDGNLVEHKTTGSTNLDEYEYNLQWDEQILAYMLMSGARRIYYTICRRPNIRQKIGETEEQFFQRCCEWFDSDTDSKIRLVELSRADAEINEFEQSLRVIANEMQNVHRNSELAYRNTCCCNKYGRCEYSSVCLFYDPQQEYAEFTRSERRDSDGN